MAGDYVVFPIVIDIAPEELTGSREKVQPIEITLEELQPAVVEAVVARENRQRKSRKSARPPKRRVLKGRSG